MAPAADWLAHAQLRAQNGLFLPQMNRSQASQTLQRRLRFLLARMGDPAKAASFPFDAEESAALETAIYCLVHVFDQPPEKSPEASPDDEYNQLAQEIARRKNAKMALK